jgi:hypothetical protein
LLSRGATRATSLYIGFDPFEHVLPFEIEFLSVFYRLALESSLPADSARWY